MIEKALVIAPHPDDEINLAGQLLISLKKKKVEVFVAYTTNGDFEKKIGNKRIVEAINANAVLGVDLEHVIFLGYPNEWQGGTHIYNSKAGEVLVSKLGKEETNSIENHPEYCYQLYGIHHRLSRENFRSDYKDLIIELLPDLIIAPEFDSHPDHRAASLMFDEIMGEILKENNRYRPIILKKYIHEGVWNGPKDYYERPAKPTLFSKQKKYAGQTHELESPAYHWDQRIRVKVDDATLTNLLKNNPIYKAAKQHKVTTAWYEMQRVINADAVYWKKRTDNEALCAKFEVSSGEAIFLNDFKYYDTFDVNTPIDVFDRPEVYCWQPTLDDPDKNIICRFEDEKWIRSIAVVEDCNARNHIKSLLIRSQEFSIEIEPNCDGSRTVVILPKAIKSDCIEVRILDFLGQPGIAEIEFFSSDDESIPFQEYKEDKLETEKRHVTVSQKLEKACLMIRFLYSFKAKYELNRMIVKINKKMQKYSEIIDERLNQ